MSTVHLKKKTADLFSAENSHGFGLFLGPDRGNLPIQGFIKNLPVQEDNGIEGLALRGSSHRPFYGQVGEKTLYITDAQTPLMGLAAEEMDETNYPLTVRLLGAVGVVMITQHHR